MLERVLLNADVVSLGTLACTCSYFNVSALLQRTAIAQLRLFSDYGCMLQVRRFLLHVHPLPSRFVPADRRLEGERTSTTELLTDIMIGEGDRHSLLCSRVSVSRTCTCFTS